MSTTIQIRLNTDGATFVPVRNVVDIRCSWEVNRAGMFSCRVPRNEFRDAFDQANTRPTYVGSMLRYTHDSAGTWGGKIMQFGVRDGMVEIGAQSLHILARKRLGIWAGKSARKPAGAILMDVVDSAPDIVAPHNIRYDQSANNINKPGYIDYANSPFLRVPDNNAIDMYDELLPMISDDVGWEWTIDESRWISYAKTLGVRRDLSLTEGVHIVSAAWTDDLSPVTNILRGIGTTKGSK